MTPLELTKATLRAVAAVAVSPVLVSFWANAALLGRDRALQNATQALALLPGLSGQYFRRAFLTRALEHCDRTAVIEFGTTFSRAGARVEAGAYIGPMCHIGLAHIGRDSLLAAGVHIPSGGRSHGIADLEIPIRDQPVVRSLVKIGPGAWIGSAAVVMADVGPGTVVGAGSVVTAPLPGFSVAAGVPARVLRQRAPGEGG